MSLAVAAAWLAACGESPTLRPTGPVPPAAPRVDASILTGDAAGALSAAGEFVLPAPPYPAGGVVSESNARARALAWAHEYGAYNHSWLERERDAPIDLGALTVCPRAFFAESPYESLPGDAPNFARHHNGPWWLVSLCDAGGVPQVSVAVAALSTETRVEHGRLKFPLHHGTEFHVEAVPLGGTVPLSPERAAQLAAAATGRRVARVPELWLAGGALAPQYARWRVALESPARLRDAASGAALVTQEVYVGPESARMMEALFVADPAVDRVVVRRYHAPNSAAADTSPPLIEYRVSVRPGAAAGFRRVEPTNGQGR